MVVTKHSYNNLVVNSGGYFVLSMLIVLFLACNSLLAFFNKKSGDWGTVLQGIRDESVSVSMKEFLIQNTNKKYFALLFTIIFVKLMITTIQLNLLNKFIFKSITKTHAQILQKIIKTKQIFFDLTPIGIVLNRFSSDLGKLDNHIRHNIYGVFL